MRGLLPLRAACPSGAKEDRGVSDELILLAHGSGGGQTHRLIDQVFRRRLDNEFLRQGDDAAVLPLPGGLSDGARLAFTTDSYTVTPLFFRGGNIGKLAVCGTVNDLAVQGADPLYLSLGLIIEEGLRVADLEKIVESIASAARQAGVQIVTGDTKVVERGKADGVYINTAGVGVIPAGRELSGRGARVGDVVLVSGTLGEHTLAILSERAGLSWDTPLESDCAPLNGLIRQLLAAAPGTRVLRDPTRGGLATTLNEIAAQSRVNIRLREEAIPVSPAVRGACDMLGFDPLYAANEGKVIAILPPDEVEAALATLRAHPYGQAAAVIGEVTEGREGLVTLVTRFGGERILDMLEGEMLPRIC
ncbi:MAG TPA: hydrogenase expression/formation protein HypE [Firmicutes bacterium]|nr:hydrogenase expression/formation protein HypE [Bacillota bacterium]